MGIVATSNRHKYVTTSVREMYTSPIFKYAVKLSERQYDQTFVLSASKGLIKLDDTTSPNDCNDLRDVLGDKYRVWLEETADQIKEMLPSGTELFFYAGTRYREVISLLEDYECHSPLEGLSIGQQMKWLKERVVNE